MVKVCPHCKATNRDDAVFCGSCGKPIGSEGHLKGKPAPSVKVIPQSQPPQPTRVPSLGSCHYHPNLPAAYVCNRCGRAVCREDAKSYLDLVLCTQCYSTIAPAIPAYAQAHNPGRQGPGNPSGSAPPVVPPPVAAPPLPPPAVPVPAPVPMRPIRPFWGFILSLVGGIVIGIDAALLLTPAGFFLKASIFPWLIPLGPFLAFVLELIAGLAVIMGAILMILGYGTIGSLLVLPAAAFSMIGGGGLVAGFALAFIGGILSMLGK